jgi:hypothetical protein
MLSNALKTKAQVAMTNFLSKVDRCIEDVDTQYEEFVNEFVGSMYNEAEPWWDFNEDDLRSKDFNELLRADADLWQKASRLNEPLPSTSVKELLRRYGVWAFQTGHQKELALMFDQVWENA